MDGVAPHRTFPWQLVPALVLWFGVAGCSEDNGNSDVPPEDGGTNQDGASISDGSASDSSASASDGGAPDGAQGDAAIVQPIPGTDECAWDPGERPTAQLPSEHTNEYVIDLDHWQISNDRGDPIETRTRMNEAIAWATDNGYDKVVVPPGTYLVGEATSNNYAGGLDLKGDMTLELSAGTIVEMAPQRPLELLRNQRRQ